MSETKPEPNRESREEALYSGTTLYSCPGCGMPTKATGDIKCLECELREDEAWD